MSDAFKTRFDAVQQTLSSVSRVGSGFGSLLAWWERGMPVFPLPWTPWQKRCRPQTDTSRRLRKRPRKAALPSLADMNKDIRHTGGYGWQGDFDASMSDDGAWSASVSYVAPPGENSRLLTPCIAMFPVLRIWSYPTMSTRRLLTCGKRSVPSKRSPSRRWSG